MGMSQWGAKGQADAGRTAPEILAHYYRGSSLGSGAMPGEVRVGVLWDSQNISLTASGAYEIRYGSPDGELIASAKQNQEFSVATDSSGSFLLKTADVTTTRPGGKSLYVIYGPLGSLLRLPQTGNRYKHGALEINTYLKNGSWLVRGIVTGLNVQQYLYGLGEVPSSWPGEALKAQAIAARTYGVEKVARLGQARQPCNCGLYPSTIDQVYIGFEKEGGMDGDRWRAAVDATDGQILMFNGRPIEAVYHSSSGGYTENNEFVWGGPPLPYLRGVPDPWDSGPRRSWTVKLTQAEMAARLNAVAETSAGTPSKIEVLAPEGVSGRVRGVLNDAQGGVRITGSSGTKRVSGTTLKRALGLLSTLFWSGEPKPPAVPAAPAVPAPPAAAAPAVAAPAVPAAVAPPSGVLKHPNGSLIKGAGSTVYLIEAGNKRPFGSPGALASRHPNTPPIPVSKEQLDLYPDGPKVGYRDGLLVSAPGQPVWFISDGKRRGFVSADVLTRSYYSWGRIRPIGSAEVALHQEGSPIIDPKETPLNGTVVKGSGPTVYLIEAGAKRPVTSAAVLASRAGGGDVVNVKDLALARFPTGPALGFADGSLIRTKAGAIFVISDGKRLHITSPERFSALKFQTARVRAVTDQEADLHPLGEPL